MRVGFRHDLQQTIRSGRDFPHSRFECLLVGLRGLAVAADLAHELERCCRYLLRGGGGGFAPKNFNAATHGGLPKILA
jgi:hypothetical protein